MKRQEFINELRKSLAHLPAGEREDILRDQEEYLHEAELAGRKEDEVIQALGDPGQLAVSLNVESKIHLIEKSTSFPNRVRSTVGAVLATLALAPFNFIFVLWPFMLAVIFNLIAWCFALSAFLFSLLLFGILIFKLIFISVGFWTQLSAFFFALGLVGIGVLILYGMVKATKVFIDLTLAYLKWNLNLIKRKVT
ncbi:MAG: DUF1700 domain-containing protein [Bdellovibrionales bacterium]|nr:DUF1700 domain-containing protein [Oligoflexia bacterium]